MADDRLRDAYARAVRDRSSSDRRGCVAPEMLLAIARREGTETERLAALDHVMACAACRPELELLCSIERAGGVEIRKSVERIRWQRYASLAVAASAVIAVTYGYGRGRFGSGDETVLRGNHVSDITAIAPASGATHTGKPGSLTFTWSAVSGTNGYTLEVITADGDVSLRRQTRDTTLTLTSADALAPGEYQWWVSALSEDGSDLRSSARRLRITR